MLILLLCLFTWYSSLLSFSLWEQTCMSGGFSPCTTRSMRNMDLLGMVRESLPGNEGGNDQWGSFLGFHFKHFSIFYSYRHIWYFTMDKSNINVLCLKKKIQNESLNFNNRYEDNTWCSIFYHYCLPKTDILYTWKYLIFWGMFIDYYLINVHL